MDMDQTLFTAMRFNFLYVDRYVFRSKWVFPESYVPYSLVRYIVKGDAVFTIDGVEYPVGENQVFYIPDGCNLECHCVGDYLEFISIRFKATVQLDEGDFLTDYYHIKPSNNVGEDRETVLSWFTEIYGNATSENPGRLFRIRGNLELIIAWLTEQAASVHARQAAETHVELEDISEASFTQRSIFQREVKSSQFKRDPRISALVDYIINHPTEQFTSERLCQLSNMSPSSMRRLFKKHTGKSPGDFIQDLRLTVAARRLLVTNERISVIAYKVGFEDPNYFSRLFKMNFGVSPQTYRKNAQ